MRRRQTTNVVDNHGIFILAPDTSAGENKYGRRSSNRRGALILVFGLLVTIAAYLVYNKHQLLTYGGVNVRMSKNITTTSRKQSVPLLRIPEPTPGIAVEKNNDNVPPIEMRAESGTSSGPPRIPRRLIFTYKYNIIAPAENDPPFDFKDPLTANVLQTIHKYHKFWDANDAKASPSNEQPKEKVEVSFLTDNICLEVIQTAEPRLVKHFNEEKRGEFKADICRIAELYLHGGYYFDIDIGVFKPLDFDDFHLPSEVPVARGHLDQINKKELKWPSKDDIVTFATVFNGQGRMFQAFTAAMPGHPVLKKSLDYMVGFYEGNLEELLPEFLVNEHMLRNNALPNRNKTFGMGLGPFTLSVAQRGSTDEEWVEYVINVMKNHGYYPEQHATSNGAKWRYARFLYEMSLDDRELERSGLFADVPRQDANYEQKVKWCNYVCFENRQVYFYSRVPGSKGCPKEK